MDVKINVNLSSVSGKKKKNRFYKKPVQFPFVCIFLLGDAMKYMFTTRFDISVYFLFYNFQFSLIKAVLVA